MLLATTTAKHHLRLKLPRENPNPYSLSNPLKGKQEGVRAVLVSAKMGCET
jgi:hypothetical protein